MSINNNNIKSSCNNNKTNNNRRWQCVLLPVSDPSSSSSFRLVFVFGQSADRAFGRLSAGGASRSKSGRCWCFLATRLCECVLHVELATRRTLVTTDRKHQRPKTTDGRDKPRPATRLPRSCCFETARSRWRQRLTLWNRDRTMQIALEYKSAVQIQSRWSID